MKVSSLTLCLLFFINFSYSQSSDIILSSIGSQEVYEGARISVYFSTLKHFETIEFTSSDLPAFGTLHNDGNGDGRFIFDPTAMDIGDYEINLSLASGNLSHQTSFKLTVKPMPSDATVYFLDPVNGDMANPGTAEAPLPSLQDVLTNNLVSINSSTFFLLRDGYHGFVTFQGSYDEPVHVLAERNHTPGLKNISFFFATNWYLSGIHISPEFNNQEDNIALVKVLPGSNEITLTNCKIYSIDDASVWATNEDWYAGCGDGIISSGKNCLYTNNYLKNTWFTIELRREECEFSYNIINWFGADAVRALDDDLSILYNQIKNATVFDYSHPIRPQHDDGIQSWTFSDPVKNMRIIGNQVIDIADPNLPLPTEIMQGIVDFDGFAEDWVIENNLVVTHHSHGIALYGAKNCKVANNTVVRNPLNYFSTTSYPWIRINPRKEEVGGDLSTGNLVRNNIMGTYQTDGREPALEDYNTIGNSYTSIFEDYYGWNFYLSESSLALNSGYIEDAPFIDLLQKRRIEDAIDAGCFEKSATLSDIEPPTTPANVSSVEITETSIEINWDDSEDNTEVEGYIISIDNRKFKSNTSNIFISGLIAGNDYEIQIAAIDHFSNISESAVYNVSTSNLSLLSTFYIPIDKHDHLIKSNSQLMWAGMPFHRIGGYFGSLDASAVLPFQLPCLDDREIVSADINMVLEGTTNNPSTIVDLYGLSYNDISCVSANMHWQGSYGTQPEGMAITEGYITPQSAVGPLSLDDNSQLTLGNYIQEQYNAGATCDDFAFLRLNINVANGTDDAYYSLISADHDNSFERPLLSIITSGTSGVTATEITNGLSIFPNPSTGKNINFMVNGFDEEQAVLTIHNAQGQEVFRKNIDHPNHISELNIQTNLGKGVYFVNLLGKRTFAKVSLVVI